MSNVQKFAQALATDAALLEAYNASPEKVMLEYGLTKEEVNMILSGDMSALKKQLGDQEMKSFVVIATPSEK
ncbi:hypothetical protein [Shewanella gaetbuli]